MIGRGTINAKKNGRDVIKYDKTRVCEAVGAASIDAKVRDLAKREVLKSTLCERLSERKKINAVLAVAVYDKAASLKNQIPESHGTSAERNAERTR